MRASTAFPLVLPNHPPLTNSSLSCRMSMTTTSDHQNGSSDPSWRRETSCTTRRESSAPRNIYGLTSPTRTPWLPPLPNKKWGQSYSNFQTSSRLQCLRVHYHRWCEECLTQTEWEPLPHTSPTRKTRIPTFGELKTATREKSLYLSHFATQSAMHKTVHKVCLQWRDELFAKAVARRTAKLAAREALRWSVHRQREACGAETPAA